MGSSFFAKEGRPVDVRTVDPGVGVWSPVGRGFDEPLGGGVPLAAAILVTGTPGAGKSTFCVQAAAAASRNGLDALYNTGEMSQRQVREVLERVERGGWFMVSSLRTVADLVAAATELNARLIVQDSLQSLGSSNAEVVASMRAIKRLVDSTGCAALVVGHSTKAGSYAGPATVKHDADVHVHFVLDAHGSRRLVVEKSRRGPTCQVDLEMGPGGLSVPSGSSLCEDVGDRVLMAAEALLDGAGESEALAIVGFDRLALLDAIDVARRAEEGR